MRVVAIDPAPGKESTLYSAEEGFRPIPGHEMRSILEGLEPPVLLCWDAPLTGPRDPENAGRPGDFTQRRLDSFFARQVTKFKTPKGISVRPYAGCPHWTISRSVLGLPRLGPFDAAYESLPFHLLPGSEEEVQGRNVARMDRSCVVEIHPAVAAWLWCKDLEKFKPGSGNGQTWKYKEDDCLRAKMWKAIRHNYDTCEGLPEKLCNDDQFDAVIGYILGVKWLRGDTDVVLLGDRETGSMLLPRVPKKPDPEKPDLCEAWESFRKQAIPERTARPGR